MTEETQKNDRRNILFDDFIKSIQNQLYLPPKILCIVTGRSNKIYEINLWRKEKEKIQKNKNKNNFC